MQYLTLLDNTSKYNCLAKTSIIVNNVKQLRDLKGLSQKEVSMSDGMPQRQCSRIENGKVMPTIPTLEKIAELLEVTIIEFFKTNNE